MKLKNKKTGEIIIPSDYTFATYDDGIRYGRHTYYSLAELNEMFEDYEEPKDFWYIEPNGVIARIDEWDCCTDSDIEIMKVLGNYFETKEEAEKAVEKLKAWKRLKDKGISLHLQKQFRGDGIGYSRTIYTDFTKDSQEIVKDLDLLFGGEK